MTEISRQSLFGKLNPLLFKSLEGATVFCKLRGNPYVELVHWLHQLLQENDCDLIRILRHFDIASDRLAADVLRRLDQLPRGATSISDFSEHIETAIERGWVYATLMFNDSQIRSAYLLSGMVRTRSLANELRSISREFDKISEPALSDAFARLLPDSPEARMRAADGSVLLEHDENIREANTIEKLATLRTIYELGANGLDAWGLAREPELGQIAHVHTAGNAPCMADGAAAVLLGSEAAVRRLGLPARARVLAQADACVPLTQTGAVDATQKALARCGLSVADIDLWEVRDSFAAITLHYIDTLGIDLERFNVNGSSIALGHPMGATGAMLVSCLLDEMELRGARYGVAAVPGAFGVATAAVFERLT